MAEENMNTSLDWDSGISADASKEFEVPAIGEYDFTVMNLEKTFSKNNDRMAVVTLALDVKGQAYERKDYLVLTTKMAWKLATFFESLGLKEKGKDLDRMPWDKVVGSKGRCKLIHEDYNGSKVGRVDRYLPRAASTTAPSAPAPEMPFEI